MAVDEFPQDLPEPQKPEEPVDPEIVEIEPPSQPSLPEMQEAETFRPTTHLPVNFAKQVDIASLPPFTEEGLPGIAQQLPIPQTEFMGQLPSISQQVEPEQTMGERVEQAMNETDDQSIAVLNEILSVLNRISGQLENQQQGYAA